MNADEMPAGREMDALVAERVLQWQWFRVINTAVLVPPGLAEDWAEHPVLYQPIESPGGLKREHLDGCWFSDSARGGATMPEFSRYSTEIAPAWGEVVEWMREKWKNQTGEPENVGLCRRFYAYLDKQRHWCGLGWAILFDFDLPLEICRAALMAVKDDEAVKL